MTEEDRQTILGVAGKIVTGIGASPVLLALVVLNLFSVGGILWSVREERELRADVTKSEQGIISDMAKLLGSNCPK